MTNTIDLIQESKERIKMKKLQKEKENLQKLSEVGKEEEEVLNARSSQYRIRFSHIQT
jgi:hypothetical protein